MKEKELKKDLLMKKYIRGDYYIPNLVLSENPFE